MQSNFSKATYDDYVAAVVQRIPKFAIKKVGKRWRTVKKALGDKYVQGHLDGRYMIGGVGKWYPPTALLDFDDWERNELEEVRNKLKMNETNSMLCSSESPNSYHLLFRPHYSEKPPTLRLLNDVFKPFCRSQGVEIYPSGKKCVRLPFGAIQKCLDPDYALHTKWEEQLYWFLKLDEYELEEAPQAQRWLALEIPNAAKIPTYIEGEELFYNGLQMSSSRHDSEWKVLYYMWRKNVPLDTAAAVTFKWIKSKHNGFSKEINAKNYRTVREDIQKQATHIYEKYTLPDETHNYYHGYICKPDIVDIFRHCDGSLPRCRFLFHLLKYYYPRRFRGWVGVHSDKLKSWSSNGVYTARLRDLIQRGLIQRGSYFKEGEIAKKIRFSKWRFRNKNDAILVDERAPETLEDSLKVSFEPAELRHILKTCGMNRTQIYAFLKQIFKKRP